MANLSHLVSLTAIVHRRLFLSRETTILLFIYSRNGNEIERVHALPRDRLTRQARTTRGRASRVTRVPFLTRARTLYIHGTRKFNIFVYQRALTRRGDADGEAGSREGAKIIASILPPMSGIVVTSTYPPRTYPTTAPPFLSTILDDGGV